MEINFSFDCKIPLSSRKSISVSILPSNDFQPSQTKRERERERARRESTPSGQPSLCRPHRCPHRPDHVPAKLFFFFLSSSSTLLLPIWAIGCHRSTSPIWLSPTTSPHLRSTAPPSRPGLSLITDHPPASRTHEPISLCPSLTIGLVIFIFLF